MTERTIYWVLVGVAVLLLALLGLARNGDVPSALIGLVLGGAFATAKRFTD